MIARMGKYDPLYNYLRRKTAPELNMTFRDIERILRAMLPNSASRTQWWVNESAADTRCLQAIAWQKAGYDAFLVGKDQVIFRRHQRIGRADGG